VNASSEYPARFSAVLFEEVLDLFIKVKTEQQEAIQASKEELLSTWKKFRKLDFGRNIRKNLKIHPKNMSSSINFQRLDYCAQSGEIESQAYVAMHINYVYWQCASAYALSIFNPKS